MSGTPTDPPDDDAHALAGEFVLGLLGPETSRLQNPDFAAAVTAWEARLMPLALDLPEIAPPASLWARIEAAIAPPKPRPNLWHSLNFWRVFGLGAAALAAACLLFALNTHSPIAVATLTTPSGGVFLASVETSGGGNVLRITPSSVTIPPGKSDELWLIAPGAKPAPLGLLASGQPELIKLAAGPVTGLALAISLEPPGGSPTGQATGPVIALAKFLPI